MSAVHLLSSRSAQAAGAKDTAQSARDNVKDTAYHATAAGLDKTASAGEWVREKAHQAKETLLGHGGAGSKTQECTTEVPCEVKDRMEAKGEL